MLALLLLMPALTAVAEGGVNEQTSLEGTPISSVDSHSEASAGEPFDISVTPRPLPLLASTNAVLM